jgi:hypothetical protein
MLKVHLNNEHACYLPPNSTLHQATHPKTVIPTGATRRFFFSFAPAKLPGRAVEEPLFD